MKQFYLNENMRNLTYFNFLLSALLTVTDDFQRHFSYFFSANVSKKEQDLNLKFVKNKKPF